MTVLVAVWAAAVMIAGVAVTVVRQGDETPSIDTLIVRVDAFVKDKAFRFEGGGDLVTAFGEGELATRSTTGYRAEGTAGGSVTRYVTTLDEQVVEMIQSGDRIVLRMAETAGELGAEKWIALDSLGGEEEIGALSGGLQTVPDFFGTTLVGLSPKPEIIRTDGGLPVLRYSFRPNLPGGTGLEVLDSDAELTVTNKGEPRHIVVKNRMRFAPDLDDDEFEVFSESTGDFRLFGWDEPGAVSFPPDNEIDTTPYIDEEDVAAFRDTAVYQPRAIPAGWVLDGAMVLDEDDTFEGCRQVELDYTDPNDFDFGYLTLYQLPQSCADLEAPRGATAFVAGSYRGWVLVEDEEYVSAQITVGSTVIQAETDLTPASLARVIGTLVTLDLTVTPGSIAGLS